MRREHNLTPENIKSVEIGLHRNGITLTGDAKPSAMRAASWAASSRCSSPARWRWIRVRSAGTTTSGSDPAIEALADRIEVVQDTRLEGKSHPFGARVSIVSGEGTLERLIPDPSGEPSSFPDTVAMQQKFLQLARPVLKERADHFADAILSLDKFDHIDRVTSLARL